jgi:hypothetical protein
MIRFFCHKAETVNFYLITKPLPRFPEHSGVPQGSILGPLPCTLYTSKLPTTRETILSTFADNTAITATHSDPTAAPLDLQDHLHNIENWLQKWKIKVNETKSSQI